MFEQVNPEGKPSGGLAAGLAILHQFVATPGTLIVSMLLGFAIVGPGQRVHPHMLWRSSGILLFCLVVALSLSYGIGRLFPARAHFGYWSWVLPTAFLVLGFCVEIGLHTRSFTSEAQEVFYPDDTVAAWTLFTIPWLQSFFYSFGLWLGAKYKPRDVEPPLSTRSQA